MTVEDNLADNIREQFYALVSKVEALANEIKEVEARRLLVEMYGGAGLQRVRALTERVEVLENAGNERCAPPAQPRIVWPIVEKTAEELKEIYPPNVNRNDGRSGVAGNAPQGLTGGDEGQREKGSAISSAGSTPASSLTPPESAAPKMNSGHCHCPRMLYGHVHYEDGATLSDTEACLAICAMSSHAPPPLAAPAESVAPKCGACLHPIETHGGYDSLCKDNCACRGLFVPAPQCVCPDHGVCPCVLTPPPAPSESGERGLIEAIGLLNNVRNNPLSTGFWLNKIRSFLRRYPWKESEQEPDALPAPAPGESAAPKCHGQRDEYLFDHQGPHFGMCYFAPAPPVSETEPVKTFGGGVIADSAGKVERDMPAPPATSGGVCGLHGRFEGDRCKKSEPAPPAASDGNPWGKPAPPPVSPPTDWDSTDCTGDEPPPPVTIRNPFAPAESGGKRKRHFIDYGGGNEGYEDCYDPRCLLKHTPAPAGEAGKITMHRGHDWWSPCRQHPHACTVTEHAAFIRLTPAVEAALAENQLLRAAIDYPNRPLQQAAKDATKVAMELDDGTATTPCDDYGSGWDEAWHDCCEELAAAIAKLAGKKEE